MSLAFNLARSFLFFAFLYLLFLSLRLVFIVFIQGEISLNADFYKTFYNAFLYDGQIIGVLSVLYFALCFLKSARMLQIYVLLCVFVTCFVNVANFGFYEIYKDVFNSALLGLIFDDRTAILKTGLSGEFNLSFKVLLWLILSVLFYLLYRALNKLLNHFQGAFLNLSKFTNTTLFLAFSLCALFAINGQIGLKGISLGKELIPAQDTFLRQITQGAYRDLGYVYKSYRQISKSSFKDYIDESPLQAARAFFNLPESSQESLNLHSLLEKSVSNTSRVQIDHVFYIIAESLSEWHFDEEFKELELMSELGGLVESKQALKTPIFLQNAASTIKSLDVQISGLYQIEIPFNLSVGKNPIFSTSAGFIFKNLGFENHFFYSGSGTWQKLDAYTLSQGFDMIFYNAQMKEFAKEKNFVPPFENAWGVFDHYLYEFVKFKALENKDKRTFSMILSTSYHPPYDVPLEGFNVPFDKIDAFLKKRADIVDKERARKVLAHIYYQDKNIARFIKSVGEALPNSLFIITGDHFDREYPFKTQSVRVQNSVPFILYAPSLKPKALAKVGAHIDIVPTLVELVAPKGFKYESFGKPLFSNNPDSSLQKNEALGYFAVSNERFVSDGYKNEYFKGAKPLSEDEALAKELLTQLKRAKALSWWIFKHGYDLRDE